MAVEAMGRGQWPWTVDVRGKGNQDVVERAVAALEAEREGVAKAEAALGRGRICMHNKGNNQV